MGKRSRARRSLLVRDEAAPRLPTSKLRSGEGPPVVPLYKGDKGRAFAHATRGRLQDESLQEVSHTTNRPASPIGLAGRARIQYPP
jgi:hypothetical protein